MGQFLPEVRGVFNLIELHRKDLEKQVKTPAIEKRVIAAKPHKDDVNGAKR